MLRPAALLTLIVAGVLAGQARAQPANPVVIAGETWQHVTIQAGDQFTRADGTIVQFGVTKDECSKQVRTAEAARPPWAPMVYWPRVDTAGGRITLCLELAQATVIVIVTPAAGKPADAGVAPLLAEVANAARPPMDLPDVGTVQPSQVIRDTRGSNLTFLIDGAPAGVGISYADHGTCAYENALVISKLGEIEDRAFAEGYSPTVATAQGPLYVCLDLREGYLSMIINPETKVGVLLDVLADVRRAAYAKHGAPISTAPGSVTLPRTGQQLSTSGNLGEWKAVDGEAFQLPGADVLVSTAGLGHNSTMFSLAVAEGPCTPGTALLAPAIAATMFPTELGPVWIDASEYKSRWRAWACINQGGVTATITIVSAIAHDAPPEPRDQLVLWPLMRSIVRSYGVELPVPAGSGGGGGGEVALIATAGSRP